MKRCLFVLLLAGCGVPEGDDVPVRWFDYQTFVTDVQPVLADRCGNPTCHGRPERPLSIYNQLAWRADPDRTYLLEQLDETELRHNYTVSCVLSTEADEPAATLFLRKSLGDLTDTYHGGGNVFEDDSERDYRALLAWLVEGWQP